MLVNTNATALSSNKARIPIKDLSKESSINESDIKQWINDYLFYGESKFTAPKAKHKSNKIKNKTIAKISKETKLEIINKYLSGVATLHCSLWK